MRDLGGAIVLAMTASVSSAQTALPTDVRSGVLIEYLGPAPISADYASMRIRIVNRSGRARTWHFELRAIRNNYVDSARTSRFELDVDNGHDRTFELLVPLAGIASGSWVQLRAYGYGVENPGEVHLVANAAASSRDAKSVNVGMTEESVPHLVLNGVPVVSVEPEFLVDDVRAYANLETLWLTESDWAGVDGATRRTIHEWVGTGGRLIVVTPGTKLGAEPVETFGLGSIVELPAEITLEAVNPILGQVTPGGFTDDTVAWTQRLVAPIETHRGVLSLLLLGYLVIAGPVNLFVLSPRAKRMRLFWSMPAIALGASALLAAIIILQDGVGGSGVRSSLVYLQPDLNRELVVQEQVARTGALFSRSFELDEPVLIDALATSYQHYASSGELVSAGSRYEGDWFKSRSIQAHRIQRSRASRARIELLVSDGNAPKILSSIDAPLAELYVRDARGQCWYGSDVLPGRPAVLQRASEADYTSWWRTVSPTAGPKIQALAEAVRVSPGGFLATASAEPSDVPIETLASIDWTEAPILYAGHVVKN